MVKFFIGVMVVAFTTYCGYLCANKYRKRKAFFEALYQFNELFLAEIAYYRRPIIEWLNNISLKGDFALFIYEYTRRVTNQIPIQGILVDDSIFAFLKNEEKTSIETYFSTLGKGDSVSQKNYFSTEKERLSTWRKKAEEDVKKYGDLYVKLGFLFGLFVLIIIV